MQLSDYVNDVQELVHDASTVSWPLTRVISRINEARLYTALDMKCIRQLVTGVQLLPNQEIYNLNGAIVGANVLSGGSNYGTGTTVPVTFGAPPPGGTQAFGFGVLTGGSLTSITMTQWGQGYTSAPAVTVGGTGSGASASAVTIINQVYPISVTYFFNNIRTTLRYLPFGLFQSYARILGMQFTSTPGVWTYYQETQQVYIQPPPNIVYLSEWDLVFMPSPLVNLNDVDTQLVDPWNRAPQFAAASLLLMKDQDAGRARSSFMARQYETMVPKIVTGIGGVRVPNIYNRNFQRMVAR